MSEPLKAVLIVVGGVAVTLAFISWLASWSAILSFFIR